MKKEVLQPLPTTEVFAYSPQRWATIANDIAHIDLHAFADYEEDEPNLLARIRERFSQPNFAEAKIITVLLYGTNRQVIGYSQAQPSWLKISARIIRTALAPEYQGQKLVGTLMNAMENELRRRGVRTFTQKVRILNGYADAVRRYYGRQGRILQDFSDGIHEKTERCFTIQL
jgi:ribosomal protein S18 acetylase RimI-like enzyme